MVLGNERKWLVAIYLLMIPTVNLQIPMSMYPMGPQIYALPPPPPIAIPFPVPVPYKVTETTTEATTPPAAAASNNGNGRKMYVAIPAPYPVPVPMPMYPPPPPPPPPPPQFCFKNNRPENCPQCPPCMPPPVPPPAYPVMPYPVMSAPSPVVVVPFPPPLRPFLRPKPRYTKPPPCEEASDESSRSEDSSDSDSGCSDDSDEDSSWSGSDSSGSSRSRYSGKHKRKKVGHVKRRPKARRALPFQSFSDSSGSDVVRPMLSYIAPDGDVKIKRRLSKNEASELMSEIRTVPQPIPVKQVVTAANTENSQVPQNVHVTEEEISEKQQKIADVPNQNIINPSVTNRQILMRSGLLQPNLGEGRKQIFFRTPDNKKITNLSVTFQINKR